MDGQFLQVKLVCENQRTQPVNIRALDQCLMVQRLP
jgi:hypothetical protein